jgi:CRISPR-associated helicase Cas3/CRISPR-associated endonuclease Cas3-HD
MKTVWAKSWPHVGDVEEWLPLWQHLDDAADVAGLLFDRWLAPSLRAVLAEPFGGDQSEARRLVSWLAGVHDVGKASPAFAFQVSRLAARMEDRGMRIGSMVRQDRSMLRHELAGAAALDRWLSSRTSMDTCTRRQLTVVVAGHHGSFPTINQVNVAKGRPDLFGDGVWATVREQLLDRATLRAGMDPAAPRWQDLRLPQSVQMLVTGVVVMADWIASGDTFPLLPVDEVPDVDPVTGPADGPSRRAVRGLRDVHLGRPWVPRPHPEDITDRFVARFPWATTGPRPVQRAVVELAETMAAPGLMILEAPMGVGKTEAAFMAAEVLAARTGATGCFVALPTQATSNAMFSRMLDWLDLLPDESGAGAHAVALVHGKAALNDDLSRLPFGVGPHAPVFDEDTERNIARALPDGRGVHAVVGQWTRGRKRAALSAFVVGTIDQVLFAALKARHGMLRHLSLAGKVVVIDEVHAADVYMSTFLDRALEWLGAAGTPVLLMSATLPAERRRALYRAYESGRRRLHPGASGPDVEQAIDARLTGDIGYPSVVVSADDGPRVVTVPTGDERRLVRLHRLDDDLASLTGVLTERLADGGCAVVIRNTVRRAQETARHLTEVFGVEHVTVAHAGFLATDRIATDRSLMAQFGPPADDTTRPPLHVVVATQVVEQSLDVDFDLMVTDAAPVDLVLQRLGRLHRHRRGLDERDRPTRAREAHCYVSGVDWSSVPPKPVGATATIYGAWPVYTGLAVLDPHLDGAPLHLPDDIAPLVQAAYAEEPELPESWRSVTDDARVAYATAQATRNGAAEAFTLAPVQASGKDLYGGNRGAAGAIDEDSPQAQGYVRDGSDSIEVVVVQRSGDGTDRIPDWVPGGGEALPIRDYAVDPDQATTLARCTLRLPFALSNPRAADAVVAALEQDYFEGWQRTPLLAGQLALVLDDDRCAVIAGHRLRYDRRLGLVVDGDDD